MERHRSKGVRMPGCDSEGEGAATRAGVRVSPSTRGQVERSRPSLAVVVPALLLFGLMLLVAVLSFRQNLEDGASAGRWVGSTASLLLSVAMVWALLRSWLLGSRKVPQREYSGSFVAMTGPAWRGSDVIVSWRFTPRWKETLACASAEGEVVLEMMFIEPHVYFPTDDAWARQAPSWAKNRRAELLGELEQWCAAREVPLTVDDKAWVAPR
jgi:hypothetical protein